MKIGYLVAVLLLLLSCSKSLAEQRALSDLSGTIRLTLEEGLWRPAKGKVTYQDLTLDLVCQKGFCEEVWGYAPEFNQSDHDGTVASRLARQWRLQVKLNIRPDLWTPQQGEANYAIALTAKNNQLTGSYTGSFNSRAVRGKVQGTISSRWPVPVPHHRPLKLQEHPRLLLRRHQLSALRAKAQTPTGQKLVALLQQSLQQPVDYDGYVPTGGYHAAGHCFLYQLQQNPLSAQRAWELVETSMARPGPRLLEQSPIVAGIALAYDLCYEAWDKPRLIRVSRWLLQEAQVLVQGTRGRGWNAYSWSNWSARARGAAGLAALALLKESPNSEHLAKVAERNITRYLTTALGDRGFGSEGDHYTTEPWLLSVIPFLVAHRNVTGYDLVPNSSAQWLLPHYVTRMVPSNQGSWVPTYGRHRSVAAEALLAAGLPIVSEQFLPGVMWGYQRYLSEQGDKVGGHLPQVPMLALLGYPQDRVVRNPAEVWGRVLADQQKGFYVFRNRWQDEGDIVASIYSKRQPLKASWSYPEVGSFRIWGLGGRWAVAGADNGRPESENVVVTEWGNQGAQPIFCRFASNGSGVVSMKLNHWLRSFAVDYSGKSGAPGLFVLVDRFANEEAKARTWLMHTEETVSIAGHSFTLQADSGATLQGRFIAPTDVHLSVQKVQGGNVIRATGKDRFFVVMTVQKGQVTKGIVTGTGLDARVQLGNQTIVFEHDKVVLSD